MKIEELRIEAPFYALFLTAASIPISTAASSIFGGFSLQLICGLGSGEEGVLYLGANGQSQYFSSLLLISLVCFGLRICLEVLNWFQSCISFCMLCWE